MAFEATQDDNDNIPVQDDRVRTALKQFQLAESHWAATYRQSMIDHKYFVGQEHQWEREVREALLADKRPALTFNQLQQFVFNVTNEQRQNPSEAQVNPDSGGATDEIARVLQDICRQVRTRSHGAPHLQAFRDMVVGGIAWWEIGTEYISPRSTKQRLIWKPVEGWSAVYIDPNAEYPTFFNADYAFKFKDMGRDEFKRVYKNKTATSSWDPFNTSLQGWIGEHHVRVCEHWFTKYEKRTLVGLEDGSFKFKDELGPGDIPLINSDGKYADMREEDFRRVYMEVISAVEVLEEPVEWMTEFIPLIPVMGEKDVIDGQLHIFGMVRAARDPQVASNFMQNHLIEAIARASKAQFLMDPAHVEDFEDYYKDANVKNRFYLPAHLQGPQGEPLASPIPINPDTPVQEIQLAVNQQSMNLQQEMGTYAASLGAQGNEESAAAILARQKPGDRSNFRFTYAFNIALKYACTQMLKMIPIVMDVPQVVRLEGLDKKPYRAAVYSSQSQPDVTAIELAEGIQGVFDLSRGEYNVEPSVGPAYETKRQETQKSLAALAQSLGNMPDELRIIIPHWVRSMDFPGHDELADQLTPMSQKAAQGDPAAQAQQAQLQNQQLQQQVLHLSQMVQQLTFDKKAEQTKMLQVTHIDKGKQALELEKIRSNERIQSQKTQAQVVMKAADIQHAGAKAILDHEVSRLQQNQEHNHDFHMALFDAAQSMANQQPDDEDEQEGQAA